VGGLHAVVGFRVGFAVTVAVRVKMFEEVSIVMAQEYVCIV